MKFDTQCVFLLDYLECVFLPNHRFHMEFLIKNIPKWAASYAGHDICAVLDIDETILCNMCENEYINRAGEIVTVGDLFEWNKASIYNPLLPLGRELIECLRANNVHVFFVSGRTTSILHETIENFDLLGIQYDVFDIFHQPDSDKRSVDKFKSETRKKILETHRIMLNVGDQITDMGDEADINYLLYQPFYIL